MSLRRVLLLIIGYSAGTCAAVLLILSIYNSDAYFLITKFQNQPESNNATGSIVQVLQPADISLPANITGTTLVAEKLICYDGAFMEDLSFDEVTNVAALLVRNIGEQGILRAEITAKRGDTELTFIATQIPPGCAVLILEKDRKSCREGNYTALFGTAETEEGDWTEEDCLKTEPSDLSMLAVTNTSDKLLTEVHLYYKTSYADGYFMIGGITHCVRIESILPGQTLYLKPKYYAGKYSKVVHIRYTEEKSPPLQKQGRTS